MLLIDGVKYKEWEVSLEEDLEQMVAEHAREIFGESSIYFGKKQKLKSLAGVGSIPDGLVIMLGSVPEWHIVEVEMSSHDVWTHVVPQVDRFLVGIDSAATLGKIVTALYEAINADAFLQLRTRLGIGSGTDIHKFLSDLIAVPPTVTIIIDKDSDVLGEALKKYPQKKVVEFRTFRREDAEAVHGHLFEPLFSSLASPMDKPDISAGVMEIKFRPSYRKYSYISIRKKYAEFFPDDGTSIELVADDGATFTVQVGKSSGGTKELWDVDAWFARNPDLGEGDTILITPIETLKRYHLDYR